MGIPVTSMNHLSPLMGFGGVEDPGTALQVHTGSSRNEAAVKGLGSINL